MKPHLLTKQQFHQAAGVFCRAFFDYPQMVCYFPNDMMRTKYLEWYLGCVIKYAMLYGDVHTNPDVSGFVCWLHPEKTDLSYWGALVSGFLLAPFRWGFKNYKRVFECEDYTSNVHKRLMDRPHYYVWGAAVEPTHHGKGIGTQLMQPGIERADQQGVPIYLETHDPKNIRFYEKLGFRLIQEDRVPKHNLPFWCFTRP
jgi:GNAT superfamily N-acetyltransferase